MSDKSPFERAAPESQGVSPAAVAAFVDRLETQHLGMHSFMLLRHGKVVAEAWWRPFAPDIPHILYSLTKSFTSTAAGFAITEGLLSLDDPVLSFFRRRRAQDPSEHWQAMRVRHLLSMTTGHEADPGEQLGQRPPREWMRALFQTPVPYAPGTHFVYNSTASHLVSIIVQKLTGQKLINYLRDRLFRAAGHRPALLGDGLRWATTGAAGACISAPTRSPASGRRCWAAGSGKGSRSSRRRGSTRPPANRSRTATTRTATGRRATASSSGCRGMATGATARSASTAWCCPSTTWSWLRRPPRPTCRPCSTLPGRPCCRGSIRPGPAPAVPRRLRLPLRFAARLAGLEVERPRGAASSSAEPGILGRVFTLERNPLGWQSLRVLREGPGISLVLETQAGEQVVRCGVDDWETSELKLDMPLALPVAATACWTGERDLEAAVCYLNRAATRTLKLRFDGDTLACHTALRGTFAPPDEVRLSGRTGWHAFRPPISQPVSSSPVVQDEHYGARTS